MNRDQQRSQLVLTTSFAVVVILGLVAWIASQQPRVQSSTLGTATPTTGAIFSSPTSEQTALPAITATVEQPTVGATEVVVEPTATTLVEATAEVPPTDTAAPPTATTEVPPTIEVPPTEAPVPPTDTPAPPPTDTPAPPPTDTPAPPPPTDTPAPEVGQTYIVQAGEQLPAIANTLGRSLAAMMVYNEILNPNDLTAGQTLNVPPADFNPTEVRHRVNPGENLSTIGRLYGVSVNAIVSRNGLADPNEIYVGQVLTVPLQ